MQLSTQRPSSRGLAAPRYGPLKVESLAHSAILDRTTIFHPAHEREYFKVIYLHVSASMQHTTNNFDT